MRFLTPAVLVLLANSVAAESIFDRLDRFYVGGGYNYIDAHTVDATGNDISFGGAELFGGYKYNGFLGAEARFGIGLTDEDFTGIAGGNSSEIGIDYHASIYWRTETANEIARIYGLLGYTTMSVSVDDGTTDESNTESGLSYGGGFGFVFEEDWNLNFEMRWLLDEDENEYSTIGANVNYRF